MHLRARIYALLSAASIAASACAGGVERPNIGSDRCPRPPSLGDVRSWACQIQGLEEDGAADALVDSPFDMLVIEPTRSVKGSEDLHTAGLVGRLY